MIILELHRGTHATELEEQEGQVDPVLSHGTRRALRRKNLHLQALSFDLQHDALEELAEILGRLGLQAQIDKLVVQFLFVEQSLLLDSGPDVADRRHWPIRVVLFAFFSICSFKAHRVKLVDKVAGVVRAAVIIAKAVLILLALICLATYMLLQGGRIVKLRCFCEIESISALVRLSPQDLVTQMYIQQRLGVVAISSLRLRCLA